MCSFTGMANRPGLARGQQPMLRSRRKRKPTRLPPASQHPARGPSRMRVLRRSRVMSGFASHASAFSSKSSNRAGQQVVVVLGDVLERRVDLAPEQRPERSSRRSPERVWSRTESRSIPTQRAGAAQASLPIRTGRAPRSRRDDRASLVEPRPPVDAVHDLQVLVFDTVGDK